MHKESNSGQNHGNTDNDGKDSQESAVTHATNSRIQESKTKEDQDDPPEQIKYVLNKIVFAYRWLQSNWPGHANSWTAWGTWVAVIAAIFYALISLLMWCQMIKQSNIASEALRRSTASFRTDERAWIEINSIKLKDTLVLPPGRPVGKIFTYDLTLKNFGKTAARDLVVKHVFIGNTLDWGTNAKAIRREQDNLTTQETATPALPKVVAPGIETMPFPLQAYPARKNIYDANAFTYVVGRIDYADAFKEKHWITFCFVVNPREEFVYCQEGNDEDNNSEDEPYFLKQPN